MASRAAAVGLIGLSALVVGYIGARVLHTGDVAPVPPIELDRELPDRGPGVTPADGEITVVPPPTLTGSAPVASTAPPPPVSVSPAPAPPAAPVLTPPRDGDDDDDHGKDDDMGSDEDEDD